jgi:hypothetical protein
LIRNFCYQVKLPQCDKFNRMLITENIFDVNQRCDGLKDLQ